MAPNTISVDSDFRVKYESTIAYDVTMNIIDEELSLVYSTQIMDSGVWYPIIDLPDLTPGAYTLIARGHDNVVVAEQPLTILSDPLITTYVTAGDLDLIQTPKIFVNSHSPHSYVPQDWIMEDIVFSGVGADESLFSLEYGSRYEGTGSGIVVLDQLPPLLSGSQLMATATISSGNTFANLIGFGMSDLFNQPQPAKPITQFRSSVRKTSYFVPLIFSYDPRVCTPGPN